MIEPLRILSLGGGTQSCALALMSAAGDLPKLDHIIFANTQGELPETYAYLGYLRSTVEAAGIPLHVVTAGSLEEALLADHPVSHNPTPPAHVQNPDGTKGRIGAYRCSYDYKRRVIEAKIKELCGGRGAWKQSNVEQWIGFSLDETDRMRQTATCRCGHNLSAVKKGQLLPIHTRAEGCTRCDCTVFDPWQVNRWPLIEMRMKRDDTIRWFAAHGHPTPPRSACWFCPNQQNSRWQALRSAHPDLFERACLIDETIRNEAGFNQRGKEAFKGRLFLHRTLTPLKDADLRTERQVLADTGQYPLFDDAVLGEDCKAEVCFT